MSTTTPALPPMAYEKFLDHHGVSSVTGWRMRKKGWIETINIAGRLYVSQESIEKFNARAAKGEFAQAPNRPGVKKAA